MMCHTKWLSATLAIALMASTAAAAETVAGGKVKSINADNKRQRGRQPGGQGEQERPQGRRCDQRFLVGAGPTFRIVSVAPTQRVVVSG